MRFDALFLGFGRISAAIIESFHYAGMKIGVISNSTSLSDLALNTRISGSTVTFLKWREVSSSDLQASTSYIAWRQSPAEMSLNDEIEEWLTSSKFRTQRFIHLSSGSVYLSNDTEYIESEFKAIPNNCVNAKQRLELYLKSLSERKEAKLINLRISNVYGENLQKGFINETKRNIDTLQPIKAFLNLNPIRDYLYLSDLVSAINQLRKIDLPSQDINVSTGIGVTISSILSILESSVHKKYTIEAVQAPDGIQQSSVLNCDKLRDTIQWNPQQVHDVLPGFLSA